MPEYVNSRVYVAGIDADERFSPFWLLGSIVDHIFAMKSLFLSVWMKYLPSRLVKMFVHSSVF